MKYGNIKDMHLWYDYISGKLPVTPSKILVNNNKNRETIDLHGLTLNEAYQLVKNTIFQNYKEITVITGASGEINRQFPFWLENHELAPKIHSVSNINNGSFLLKLNKNSSKSIG